MSIELKNVTKRFGATTALDNVSVTFAENRIYGLLGNNGAGKSTMLNLITNRIFLSDGEVLIDGESVENNDRALGKVFMQGELNLYPDTMRVKKAFEQAKYFYPDFDESYAKGLAEKFGLNLKKKIISLSTGYSSIFRLIMALSVNAPYILLDEPVLGLDAIHRDLFYKTLIEKYSDKPSTIIISTHLIQEIAKIIEYAVIIKDGRIIKDIEAEALTRGCYSVSGPAAAVDEYARGKSVISEAGIGGLRTVCIEGETPKKTPAGLEIGAVPLQDYFIALMNKEDK